MLFLYGAYVLAKTAKVIFVWKIVLSFLFYRFVLILNTSNRLLRHHSTSFFTDRDEAGFSLNLFEIVCTVYFAKEG